jgi:hypothetical protein
MLIDEDLVTIRQRHYPGPPASAEELATFESRWGFKLDPDLTAFYAAANGARLYDRVNPSFEILPLNDILLARNAIFGKDDDAHGPPSILAICDVQDGNYIGIDTSRIKEGCFPVLDIFHETFPEQAELVADSFGEFLHKALGHGGRQFWLYDGE